MLNSSYNRKAPRKGLRPKRFTTQEDTAFWAGGLKHDLKPSHDLRSTGQNRPNDRKFKKERDPTSFEQQFPKHEHHPEPTETRLGFAPTRIISTPVRFLSYTKVQKHAADFC